MDSEIAGLTISLAEHRILLEHLRSRLAEGSPDAPRSERERRELQAKLDLQRREMERLAKELSALCGDATAVRGYMGVWTSIGGTGTESGGTTTMTACSAVAGVAVTAASACATASMAMFPPAPVR